jgi:S-disulfanyl-L-cysteine oxidoreductase SoxD
MMKISLPAMAGLTMLAGACVLWAQADTSRSVWDGVFTAEQSARGDKAYSQNCASCHGTSLTGGESAPPLAGGEFSSNWYGLTLGDLFDRIRTTMPADRPGKVSRDQCADILAYILSMNQFPAGQSELPGRSEILKQIRLEASAPQGKK